MKRETFLARLEERFPKTLSCDWDKDGVMILPAPETEVKRVLCCLDLTEEAARYAVDGGFDLILCHHSLIFQPLRALNVCDPIAARAARLYAANTAVCSFHTRLDCAAGGVNDALAELFSLQQTQSFEVDGQPMGRVGTLPRAMAGEELAQSVKTILGSPAVRLSRPEKTITRLAVLGGGGGEYHRAAALAGADALLTGEARHHELLDARDAGFCLIAAGHDYTERPVTAKLRGAALSIDPGVYAECYTEIALPVL